MTGGGLGGAGLLERDDEVGRIETALRAACEGRGSFVALEGPAGIGKSALLDAARRAAAARGMLVLRARGAELEREFAFGAVRQLLEPPLRRLDAAESADLLSGPAAVTAGLLAAPMEDGPSGSPDTDRFAVLHGLYWLCANMSDEHPLCLCVDDAHWLDISSLGFLAYLERRIEELPVVVVLTTRPPEGLAGREVLAALLGDPVTRLSRLRPLGADSVAALLREGLGAAPDPAFVEACHRATGGTPFLLGALVAELRDAGVRPTAAAADRVLSMESDGVRRWTLARLAALPPEARSLARAASILEEAELAEAAQLADLDPPVAAEAADLLGEAGILRTGRPLAFMHPVVRAAVYRETSLGSRRAAHALAARILAARGAAMERVAQHLLDADPSGEPWVVEQLRAAARRAMRNGAPDSASTYLGRALAEPPDTSLRPQVLLELGEAEAAAGLAACHEHLDAAMATAPDPSFGLTAAMVRARVLSQEQRIAEAVAVLDRAGSRLDPADQARRLVVETVSVWLSTLDADVAPDLRSRAMALRERAATDESAPRGLVALAALLSVGANEPAGVGIGLARRALAAGVTRGSGRVDPWFRHVTLALLWAEAYDELGPLLDRAVDAAHGTRDGLLLAALDHRACLALRRGDLSAAETDARTVLELFEHTAPVIYRLQASAVLVEVLVEQGRLDQAERALVPHQTGVEGPSTAAVTLRQSRGYLRLVQGRPREALTDLLAVGEACERLATFSPGVHSWRSLAALAHLELGDPGSAAALATAEIDLARAFGAPRALGRALRAGGLVTGGTPGEAMLREAVAALETAGARLELARVLTDLGGALRRAGRPADARPHLRRAADLADRAGAGRLADEATLELRATGARPRRTALTGPDALTASEARVAQLAAQGLSNRQIAQSLFVTARTVEGHLTQAFAKLHVGSRGDLAAALSR